MNVSRSATPGTNGENFRRYLIDLYADMVPRTRKSIYFKIYRVEVKGLVWSSSLDVAQSTFYRQVKYKQFDCEQLLLLSRIYDLLNQE